MHGRCQKCGTVEVQGNKRICPACAYQPTEQELERANFAFNELKKRNDAAASEERFIKSILYGQPEPPMYFARMKKEYKEGPAILGQLPSPKAVDVETLKKALAQAEERGLVGKNILGSGIDIDLQVFEGHGSYVAGEETAMLESMQGRPAMPRQKPPFYPTDYGLYGKPTLVNKSKPCAISLASFTKERLGLRRSARESALGP